MLFIEKKTGLETNSRSWNKKKTDNYERYLVNEQRTFFLFSNVRTSFDIHDKNPMLSIAMAAKSSLFCLFISGDCVYLLSLDG